MECIRSLQGMSKVFDKKLQKISDDASTNEDQITSSLQQVFMPSGVEIAHFKHRSKDNIPI